MKFKSLLVLPLLVASLQAASVSDLTFTLNADGTEYSVTDCDTAATGKMIIPNTYNVALHCLGSFYVNRLTFSSGPVYLTSNRS